MGVGGILDVVLYVTSLAVQHRKAGLVDHWYTTLLISGIQYNCVANVYCIAVISCVVYH